MRDTCPDNDVHPAGSAGKTDARDAHIIAQCLSYGGYHAVYILTEEDDPVKEYLRMRNDHKLALKKVKQQINVFCLDVSFYYNQQIRKSMSNKTIRQIGKFFTKNSVFKRYCLMYNKSGE
ncbi:MAG: hypothetical protein NC246_11615, partial [Muribaculaceae bacterium]|nr:hypothetical protein [Muribaculaceae bacterium]